MSEVRIQKDRRMIANELVSRLRLEAWEGDELAKLRHGTLLRIAASAIPAFEDSIRIST